MENEEDAQCHTARFLVGGQHYAISAAHIDAGPSSRLSQLYACAENKSEPIAVDRPSEMFGAILAFYQTQELHMPITCCPNAFLTELEYWGIGLDNMTVCCQTRLQRFLGEQKALMNFRERIQRENNPGPSILSLDVVPALKHIRTTVWTVIGCRPHNIIAWLYLIGVSIVVLASIFVVSFGTLDQFHRNLTNCERVDIMEDAGTKGLDHVVDGLMMYCNSEDLKLPIDTFNWELVYDSTWDPELEEVAKVRLEYVEAGTNSYGDYYENRTSLIVPIPTFTIRNRTFDALHIVFTLFFTLELLLRLFSCPCIIRYFMSIINITDAVALVTTYIHLLAVTVSNHYQYKGDLVDHLQFLLVLRSLRLFRLVGNVNAGRVFAHTLHTNVKELLIVVLFLVAGSGLFATMFNAVEGQTQYLDVPQAWYWAIITMATVGYGDICPQTGIGYVIACICAVSGVIMFGLTVPIVTGHFTTLYHYAKAEGYFNNESRIKRPSGTSVTHVGDRVGSHL